MTALERQKIDMRTKDLPVLIGYTPGQGALAYRYAEENRAEGVAVEVDVVGLINCRGGCIVFDEELGSGKWSKVMFVDALGNIEEVGKGAKK